jgi:hypothetical protein
MYNGGEGGQMTAQAKDKRGIWQNVLGRDGRKAPEEAAVVTEPSLQIAAPDSLLEELARFVGDSWEQEDDITLVTLQRSEAS